MKKPIIFFLSALAALIFASCSKEGIADSGTLSFSAAYTSGICMSANPVKAVITFDEMTVEIPVMEINTGVISTVPVEIHEGTYRLRDIKIIDAHGNIKSYFEKDFHRSGWVVTPILDNWFVEVNGDTTVRGQLFCDEFWKDNK